MNSEHSFSQPVLVPSAPSTGQRATSRRTARTVRAVRAPFALLSVLALSCVTPLAANAAPPAVTHPAISSENATALSPETETTDDEREPRLLEVKARLADEGHVEVTETFTWDPDHTTSHITRTLPLFVQYSPESWRQFEYASFTVSGDSADMTMKVLDDSHKLVVDITPVKEENTGLALPDLDPANPDDVTPITVTFTYTVGGALASFSGGIGQNNEFFWAPLVSGGYAFDQVDFTLQSSRPAIGARCEFLTENDPLISVNEDDNDAENDPDQAGEEPPTAPTCSPQLDSTPQIHATDLSNATGLALRYEFPAGTFDKSSAIYVSQPQGAGDPENPDSHTEEFDPTWSENIDFGLEAGGNLLLPVTASVVILVFGGLLWALTRKRPDLKYANLPDADVEAAKAATAALAGVGVDGAAGVEAAGVAGAAGTGVGAAGATERAKPTTKIVRVPKQLPDTLQSTAPTDLGVGESGAIWSLDLRWIDAMATLVSLAERGHLKMSRSQGSSEWILTPTPHSEDTLNRYEQTLLRGIFADDHSIYLSTIHSRFAPQILEALSVLGHELREEQLVTSYLDHEASSKAARQQRTPLGRAYAEQLAGFRSYLINACDKQLEALPAPLTSELFYQYLPLCMTFGIEHQWAQAFDTRGVSFAPPSWFASRTADGAVVADATTETLETNTLDQRDNQHQPVAIAKEHEGHTGTQYRHFVAEISGLLS